MPATADYHRVGVTRAKELPMRLVLALVIAGATWAVTRSPWVSAWLAAMLATQLIDLKLTAPMRRDPDFQPTPRQEAVYLASIALNVAVYSSITPLCWLAGGLEGHLFAMLVPTAGLINVSLQAQSAPKLLWAGCIPHGAYLVGLPLTSILFEQTANPLGMAFVALGAALYMAHLFIVVRRNRDAAVKLAYALEDAELERARAEDASAAKSAFLATMSHEIRTPLNGVLGMAQAMSGDSLPKRQRERLEVIRQSGEVLLLLLNDLLDISKIEAAKLELEKGVLDLQDLGRQAHAAFAPLAAEKGLELAVAVDPALAGGWSADATRVRQIVYNLLSNAVKFTESGAVRLAIEPAAGAVAFRVSDTGPGVEPERLPRLFERFIQADASTTRRYGGSGLGLAISRELARLMGGDITAESEPGRGSAFTAFLPLERAEAPAAPAPSGSAAGPREGLRVLVAEDNETNQLVLATLLGQVGVATHLAADGAEAVELWRRGGWDLVLMDVQMPVMDGVAATRRIREIEAAERRPRTPIVALTANAMAHHTAEYLAAGMDGVAAKPIQLPQLLAEMGRVLEPPAEAPAAKAG